MGQVCRKSGKNKRVYLAGTEAEIRDLFDELTRGATKVDSAPDYDGRSYRIPDGTYIGLRSESKWGGLTIDVAYGRKEWKVHLER